MFNKSTFKLLHCHLPFVSSSFFIAGLVVVLAQQLWVELGTVVWIKTVATIKCLVKGLYHFFDAVLAITPFVAPSDCLSLLTDQVPVVLIAEPNPGRSTPTHANTIQSLPCR